MRTSIFVRAATAGLILAPLAACHGHDGKEHKADRAKIEAEVKALTGTIVDGYNGKNAEKAVSVDADDYLGMFHGFPNAVGKAADLAITRTQVTDPNVKLRVSNETVDVARSGDLAVYRATYSFTQTDPKTRQPVTETGNWVAGFKPQPDGALKMAWSVVSDTPSATAPAATPAPTPAPAK